jgi:hypothetical protein
MPAAAPRAALLQRRSAHAAPVSRPAPADRPRTARAAGTAPVVVTRKGAARPLPHWKQAERWFWLTHPESLDRELVKPAGTTHTQGPHEMVQYTTQGGSLKACSVMFFEANTQPYVPGTGWR